MAKQPGQIPPRELAPRSLLVLLIPTMTSGTRRMKTTLAILALASVSTLADRPAPLSAKLVDLRCEYQVNPGPISNPKPRFGWRIETEQEGFEQQTYQILVASSAELLGQNKGDLWDSGQTGGDVSQAIRLGGEPLKSKQEAHWKVRVKATNGKFSPWSESATFTFDPKAPPALPKPLFPPNAPRRSAVETSDPTLNKIFEAAAEALPKIEGLRDSSYSLRAGIYHTEAAWPRAEQWFLRANESVNAGGLYPATLPSKGTQVSTESDAPIWFAHTLWWMTGDSSLPSDSWDKMTAHVSARRRLDPEMSGKPLGTLPKDTLPPGDRTPHQFVHQASTVFDLRFLYGMNRAAARGPFEVLKLRQALHGYRESFKARHLTKDGNLKYQSITAHLLALRSGLLATEEEKKKVTARLISLLKTQKKSPFEQSPYASYSILPVLSWTGHLDHAVALAKGQNPEKLSPVALASISEWLISMMAGIETEALGFKHIRLTPFISSPEILSFAKGHFDSPYGRISTSWRHEDGSLSFEATTPPNTTLLMQLPVKDGQSITENGQPVETSKRYTDYERKDNLVSFRSGSGGHYKFKIGK